jgi:D-lactate dehydrogenase
MPAQDTGHVVTGQPHRRSPRPQGPLEDQRASISQDDTFARLLTFPNVLITTHQAFLAAEALTTIAETTIANLSAFERDGAPVHEVAAE